MPKSPVKYFFFNTKFRVLGVFFLFFTLNSYSQDNHYIIIDTITFEGNDISKKYVIERELMFKKDSIYESANLDEMSRISINLLLNTNLFITADVKWTETRRQHVSVHVSLSEKWYIWPIPSFELADRNYKQWADLGYKPERTNYGLYLFIYNFRGRNETLKLSFINGYTRNYGIQYTVPFLDKTGKFGLDINSSFKQNKEIWYLTKNNKLQFYKNFEKTLIQRLENRMAFTNRHNNFTSERWELEFNQIKIKDTIQSKELNPNFLLAGSTQNEFFVKHIFNYEKRDNKYYPLTGFYFKNELAVGSLKGDTASIDIIKETMEFGTYREIYKKLYLSGFFKAKISNQPAQIDNQGQLYIPYNNFKAFGYKDFVRGYEQYVVDGHAFMLAKLNLKYAIMHRYLIKTPVKIRKHPMKLPTGIYCNLYADWGKAYNNQWGKGIYNNTLANTDLLGYGVGLDILFFNDKIFRFEYSLNLLGDKNFNLHFEKSF